MPIDDPQNQGLEALELSLEGVAPRGCTQCEEGGVRKRLAIGMAGRAIIMAIELMSALDNHGINSCKDNERVIRGDQRG